MTSADPGAATTLSPHPAPWTLAEVLALPEDQGNRVELVDGLLVVSPSPGSGHQRLLVRLMVALARAVPPEYESLPGVNVVLGEQRLVIPDLVVTTVPGLDAGYVRGEHVLLVVEIHAPATRTYEVTLKRRLYAEAGITFLLFAEPGSATLFELVEGDYRVVTTSVAGRLKLSLPFPMGLDLSVLGS